MQVSPSGSRSPQRSPRAVQLVSQPEESAQAAQPVQGVPTGVTAFVTPVGNQSYRLLNINPTEDVTGIPIGYRITRNNAMDIFKVALENELSGIHGLPEETALNIGNIYQKLIAAIEEKRPTDWHNIIVTDNFINSTMPDIKKYFMIIKKRPFVHFLNHSQ